MRAVLAVNPIAGGGRALKAVPGVLATLRDAGWTVTEVRTRSAAHARDLAAEVSDDALLVGLGGDGLIACLAAGALAHGTTLAPLPGGRGNDFIRALGVSTDARVQQVDVGRVVRGATGPSETFLGVASLGFDSRANAIANETSWLSGPPVYAYAGVLAWLREGPRPWRVTVDGRVLEFDGWNVAIGNSGRYGGGMKICPDASLTDGLLDVVIFKEIKRWEFFPLLRRVFDGRHIEHDEVETLRGREVTVEALPRRGVRPEPPPVVFADGDPIAAAPITVTTLPGALSLRY